MSGEDEIRAESSCRCRKGHTELTSDASSPSVPHCPQALPKSPPAQLISEERPHTPLPPHCSINTDCQPVLDRLDPAREPGEAHRAGRTHFSPFGTGAYSSLC